MDCGAQTSVLSDLGNEPALGRFDFTTVTEPLHGQTVFLQAIAAEGNPRDKAKEWGARQLSSLYRIRGGEVRAEPPHDTIFIMDGIWAQSDVTRLYRSGWSQVVRMGQLEATLAAVFGIETSTKERKAIHLPTDLSDLPMAAEED